MNTKDLLTEQPTDELIHVKHSQLQNYIKTAKEWEKLVKEQQSTIEGLKRSNECLSEKLQARESRVLDLGV